MTDVIIIAHDLRSTHNVGSLLRTADGFGATEVVFTGYTPYPHAPRDTRLPHLAQKIDRQIHKTALGAEATQPWRHARDVTALVARLKKDGYAIAALEQAPGSVRLSDYRSPAKVALLLGREVEGLEPALLELADDILEIPMLGQKESFNVIQAAAIALYQLRYGTK